MSIVISRVRYDRQRHLTLLLLADPEETAVLRYIGECALYEARCDGKLAGVAAVLTDDCGMAELKNIAVDEAYSRQGIGSALVQHALSDTRAKRFIVGTADASEDALSFYRRNGFAQYGRIENFFIDHYENPIFDCGSQCRDMILLEWRERP